MKATLTVLVLFSFLALAHFAIGGGFAVAHLERGFGAYPMQYGYTGPGGCTEEKSVFFHTGQWQIRYHWLR